MNVVTEKMVWVEAPIAPVAPIVAAMLGEPVRFADVVEQHGQVAMVRFEPLSLSDPTLPVVLFPVAAEGRELWRKLLGLLGEAAKIESSKQWVDNTKAWRSWYNKFDDTRGRFVATVCRQLSPSELAWLQDRLLAIQAQPLNYVR